MEIAIKVVWTLVALMIVWGIGSFTVTVWRSHIDPQKTFSNIVGKFHEKPTEVLATRDADAFYQNGEVVGRVIGQIVESGGMMMFEDVADTSSLDRAKDIEFRRRKIRIESIESFTGLKLSMDGTTSSMRSAVISKVRCRILD